LLHFVAGVLKHLDFQTDNNDEEEGEWAKGKGEREPQPRILQGFQVWTPIFIALCVLKNLLFCSPSLKRGALYPTNEKFLILSLYPLPFPLFPFSVIS
jgi:hypothetical protein